MIVFEEAETIGPIVPHSEDWHKARSLGIGGSESAAILGLSKYKSAFELYQEKIGERPRFEGNDATRLGQQREPVIRDMAIEYLFGNGTSWKVMDPSEYSFRNMKNPHLIGNLDGIIYQEDDEEGMKLGLEIKTANPFAAKDWKDNKVPAHYWVQVQHYMAVTGLMAFWVLCEVQDKQPYIISRFVERDDAFIEDRLIPETKEFWSRVRAQFWPDGEPGNEDELKAKHPQDTTGKIVEDASLSDLFESYQMLQAAKDNADEQLAKIKMKIMARIGDNKGVTDGRHIATWSNRAGSESFDRKAFEKEYPNLAPLFTKKGEPTRTFKIEVKK